MDYFSHPLVQFRSVEARDYQITIAKAAAAKNTLCVLPTGTGKTAIAIMVAAERMELFPGSRVMIVAPTRPLAEQHQRSFQKMLDIPPKEIMLMTGKVPPDVRRAYYLNARVVCATPQTIQQDLLNGRLKLTDYSLIIVDEVHRAVKKYAYPFVARKYMEQSSHPRILGLTASPGSDKTKINEICKNLGIEHVEIRTETDSDMKDYVQETRTEVIEVELTDEMKEAQRNLHLALHDSMERLKKLQVNAHNKRELIEAQQSLQKRLLQNEKNPIMYHQISAIAETIKIGYILELLETQSLAATIKYIEGMGTASKAAKRILSDLRIKLAWEQIKKIKDEGNEHPKMERLLQLVKDEIAKNKNVQIIIFSHYRQNIAQIWRMLKGVTGCMPVILIGQGGETGMSQKEQIEIIKDYDSGVFNTLITSPIGEEGLHMASADIAIFYEPVSSEIRTIQRRGRVGRTKLGRIIVLLTVDTRDEANFYIARKKEHKMKEILKGMQDSPAQDTAIQDATSGVPEKRNLLDFTEK